MLIVGLTGGIACGKSTVSKELQTKYNLKIIDADLIAKQVVEPGKPAYNKIIKEFKPYIPNLINEEDQTLNRANLGQYVFENKHELKKLNSIVHPAVKYEILKQILLSYIKLNDMIILDVPLLFESKLYLICGIIITVSISPQILQIKRLIERNPELTELDAKNRINNQMSMDERNYKSDYILDNSGSLKDLTISIEKLIKKIKPNKIWTILDLIPPIGLLSALYTFVTRRIIEKYKNKDLKQE
ncbi:CAB5 [Candida pseudojiufengensis]|uniref:CAB5 n=1 Tax=Candida pseudojiufengensis TaxID=497109 RepID=UPI0022244DE3|nr:CAB5 [Candida pseudojiufengensis]KAI5964210.1 CAB5 [Candida pseudojiufengensis]